MPTDDAGTTVDVEVLADWLEGRMSPARHEEVRAALGAGEQRTETTLRWLRQFYAAARGMPLVSPPPVVSQHLVRHFRRWHRARAALTEQPMQLTATLLFDSRLDLATAGVRGAAEPSETVHLGYTTDRADLVLDLIRTSDGLTRIEGQVFPASAAEAPVFEAAAIGSQDVHRTVDGDELGRFVLSSVPADVVELRLTNGDVTIVAPLNLSWAPES